MATMATMRSPSPAMGDPSRESHRGSKARPAPESRGVKSTHSDGSLGEMSLVFSKDEAKLHGSTGSLTNRQRVANLHSQMNGSGSSLVSEGSRESRHHSSRQKSSSSRRRTGRATPTNSVGRRARSVSPDFDDGDETVASSSSKRKPRSGRSTRGNNRTRSRSRSKSKSRSKSLNARNNRRRNVPSRTTSGESKSSSRRTTTSSSSRSQSPGSLEMSPGALKHSSSRTPKSSPSLRSKVSASRRLTKALLSPPLSAESISEFELLDFLKERSENDGQDIRNCVSVPAILMDDNPNSGRLERSTLRNKHGSQRRERTSNGDRRVDSNSSYTRPPRNARGVNRSQSAAATSGSKNGTVLSPRRPPASRGVNRTTSGSDTKRQTPPRSKSTDDMGNLSSFFSKNTTVSRRKKPGMGSRSVASMPARARRRGGASSSASEYGDPSKPPSSRSTVATATETYYSEEEDDSIDESLEDLNDIPRSASSMDTPANEFSGSFSHLSMESALQMHMSRTENLLFEVFPKHIAEALRSGRKVEPENHECVTIFFSDIVGFTNISSELDPLKISDLLDRLYNSFDALSIYHNVFKVETIGDAYMAVTNVTEDQPDHCKRIAEFAIDAVRVANQTMIDKDDPSKGFVNIRVGFHSGPVVSNVVGSRNPRFCLFGDTVNTASRMESNSAQNRIHCSESSYALLRAQHPELSLNPRGVIEVKGKGQMKTYWVNEDAAFKSQRDGSSRSIFKLLKRSNRRSSMQ